MGTAIGSILPMLALRYFADHNPMARLPWWTWAGALLFGAALALWFVKRTIDRECWRLTDSELVGGWSGGLRLPLSSIEKVIVGLPAEWPIPGMDKVSSPRLREALVLGKDRSLLLKFQGGAMLPLTLHRIPNGSALLSELVSRLQDRVATNHSYSEKETRLLRRADPNALIRG
jgi:hypothetical protein